MDSGAPVVPRESAGATHAGPTGAAARLEALLKLQLRNKFFWLAIALALVLNGQLTYIQWQYRRFDTLELASYIVLIVELALLAMLLLNAAGLGQLAAAWRARYADSPFPASALGVSALLLGVLTLTIELAPMLFLHRYPELLAEQISIPLLLLQRCLLLALACLVTFNIALIAQAYFRLHGWLSVVVALAWHACAGYCLTNASFSNDALMRLNDVFFFNKLWNYTDLVPKLAREEVFHKIALPYFGQYLAAGLALWLFTYLLWLPRVSKLARS